MQNTKPEGTKQNWRLWSLICALYVTQGIPLGVAFEALPAILRKLGFETQVIGFIGLLMVPWAIKFLWAAKIDRYSNNCFAGRKKVIVPAQLILAISFFAIAGFSGGSELAVVTFIFLFIGNLASVTQDIATDGLAIDLVAKSKMGWVNGFQIGGFACGMLIGGVLTTALFDLGGWPLTFCILGSIVILTLIPVLLVDKQSFTQTTPTTCQHKASLIHFFKRSGVSMVVSIAAVFFFARTMVNAMIGPFLVDSGFELSVIAVVTAVGVTSMAIIGALAGSVLVKVLPIRTAVIASSLVSSLVLVLWLVAASQSELSLTMALVVVIVNGIASGVMYVAVFTLFMQWASPLQGGTDFSFLQCSETLTNIMAAILGGFFAGSLGYTNNFLIACCIAGLSSIWVLLALSRIQIYFEESARA